MLKEIRMSGIKGQEAVQPLTGRDIIIGRNGSGKTTRMQAMSLAAFGYVPDKGKTAESTFELASEDTMEVGIVSDDCEITREYKKTSKLTADGTMDVKISQGITISPSKGERTIKEKEQRIHEEVGNFPTMLDFNSFIELTDIKQRDFIYNLSGGNYSWDRQKVADRLREAVLRDELGMNNPEMYDIMERNYEETMKMYYEKLDVQSGLLAMTEYAKEKLSYWKREKNNADAAAKKLTELKNRGMETDRYLAENQEKLKELEAEKEEKQAELAKLTAQNHIIEEKAAEHVALTIEIEGLESAGVDEEKIKALREELAETTGLLNGCATIIERCGKEAEVKTEDLNDLQRRMDDKYQYINKLKGEKKNYEATINSNSKLIERIAESKGHCAFSPNITCGHDFSEFIESLNNENDKAYDAIDSLDTNIQLQEEEYRNMYEECIELKNDIERAHKTAREASTAQTHYIKDISDLKEALHQLENYAPILTAKTTQKAEIKAWLEENPKIELLNIEEEIEGLKAKIEALKETIDEQKKIRNDIKNIKANIIDSQTAAYEQECWSQIAEAIGQKGIQGAMVKEMLDPMRKTIDEKLEAMNLPFRFYFRTESDRGKEVFEFGGLIHGAKRPFEALSQGEQLLLLVAMMTTIIERSNPPIKILAIDNINHLDRKNLQRIIEGLNEAGKNMDNIILAGTPEITDAPGWKIWNLSEA